MASARCPKCASANAEGAWICARCDWILDPSVLDAHASSGRDALLVGASDGSELDDDDDDPRTLPVLDAPDVAALLAGDAPAPHAVETLDVDLSDLMGGDAVILGALGEGEAESLLSDRTGSFLVAIEPLEQAPPAPVYLSGDVARLLTPTAVPRRADDALARRGFLRPVEGLVFDFVDGQRTLHDLRAETGISENDMRVVLALLIEKAMVEVAEPPAPAVDIDSDAERGVAEAAVFDEQTSELPELVPHADHLAPSRDQAPFTAAPPRVATPPPTQEVFDELAMEPLPELAAEQSPWAPRVQAAPAAPQADGFQLPRSDAVVPARPAMNVAPVRPRPRNTPMPPSSARRAQPAAPVPDDEPKQMYKAKAGLTVARSIASPATAKAAAAPAASQDAKARAAQFYEMAMKDLNEGRAGRAWGYAKMAADADPSDEKYRLLLADWGKMVGGTKAAPASGVGAKELFEACQQAEQDGDYEAAVAHVRKVCEMAPTSAAAFNRLSVLLATRLKDFKGAYAAATTAVGLDSNNMTYQSNMMKILTKLEENDDQPAAGGRRGLVGKLLGK